MPPHVIRCWGALVMLAIGLVSCQRPDRFLIHPHEVPPQVQTWAEEVDTGLLRLRLLWAKPAGPGPFPTVLVHPDGGATAADMRGVLWDLASRGYLAVAADYRRRRGDVYRRTLVPWCAEAESTAVLAVLHAQPWVDPQRVGALGFSHGGILSLLLAAQAAEIKAVVAYYPVTDWLQWLAAPRAPLLKRLVFSLIRAYFYSEAAECPQESWQSVLQQASPLYQAERIQAPVLLLHGDQDGAAPAAESRRLAARLTALGREVALVVIAGGRHVFNFKHPAHAQYAWQITLQWLAHHLGPGPSSPVRAPHPHARVPGCSQR